VLTSVPLEQASEGSGEFQFKKNCRESRNADDKTSEMATETPAALAGSEIRFLEYRLEVVNQWPASARKQATLEAVTRRLASLATAGVARGSAHDDMVALSCRLMDGIFYGGPASENSEAVRARN